ncbi:DAOA isoform 11, partial [Pan troglodytes]
SKSENSLNSIGSHYVAQAGVQQRLGLPKC